MGLDSHCDLNRVAVRIPLLSGSENTVSRQLVVRTKGVLRYDPIEQSGRFLN